MKLITRPREAVGRMVTNSALLSVLLVTVTAAVSVGVFVLSARQVIEQRADRDLGDRAAYLKATLENSNADLVAVGNWLTHDSEFVAAANENRREIVKENLDWCVGDFRATQRRDPQHG